MPEDGQNATPEAKEPLIVVEAEVIPPEKQVNDEPLSHRGKKALDYLVRRLLPFCQGEGGEDFLREILTPLLKVTHSRKVDWKHKIQASKELATLVGLYTAVDNHLASQPKLPGNGTFKWKGVV